MAFNLTAELQLQANNSNINQVVNQIQQQLKPIGDVNVKINTNTKAIQQAANQVQRLDKGFKSSQRSASELNRTLVESARRFSVITVATGSLLSLVNAFKNSVKSALDFEVELAKISQVTGKTVKELGDLSGEVRKLSRELGVGNQQLLNTSRILLQTGISAEKTKQALDILARTTLAATFDDIQDTTEGAIALLNQFGAQARRTGQDIVFLEDSLDAINAVSKKFAVESADLIGVVRRVGGVFSAAGGDVKELIALFTSVRQTTRESAETIATGLRTIFTRLQRTDTVNALKDLNIELQDSKGQFVGAFEAVKRLSIGLSALDPKDFRFSAIVEELGGFRQVGKVIPLIKQFTVAQNALNVAQNASGSIIKDSVTAQQTLANRFAKTREKFDELIARFADSSTFRSLANGFLTIADSLIRIGNALEPVLPLLTALFALKVGSGLASGISLLRGFTGGGGGGGNPIIASRFATGGPVPGSGNRDTVPAMLTPGEFVIRKSSVKKIGMKNLAQMNAKGYNDGGPIKNYKEAKPYLEDPVTTLRKNKNIRFNAEEGNSRRKANRFNSGDTLNFSVERKSFDVNDYDGRIKEARDYKAAKTASERGIAFEKVAEKALGLKASSDASSRIDSVKGNTIYELKSVKEQVTNKAIAEKMLGAAIRPFGGEGEPDQVVNDRLTKNNNLSEGEDKVDLGKVVLLSDTSKDPLTGDRLDQGAKKVKSTKVTEARKKRLKGKNLGGLIQKFAAGGAVQSILGQNKVGAVNLDLGKDNDVKLGVTLAQVNATQTVQKNNALKNKAGVRKYLQSKGKSTPPSYTLKRKSLDEKTGDQFRKVIVDELVKGVDGASNRLGQDLIGQPVQATDDAKKALRKNFNKQGGAIALAYEDVLNVVANKGDFAPADLFQPFDFPNGLQPPLVDNFAGVPNAFVDARKAQTSKDKQAFERKIANQIALEADASEFGKLPDKAQRAALGGMIKKFARGGAASDTVPAMLTPGEFVLNKDAARNIGAARLDAMNKKGKVQGFNKGGAVQYLNSGGRPRGGQFGLSGTFDPNAFGGILASVQSVEDALARVGVSAETFAQNADQVEQILQDGGTEVQAFNTILDQLADSSREAKEQAQAQAAEQQEQLKNPTSGNTVASDENLSSAQNVGNNAAVGTASVQAITAAAGNSEDLRSQLEEAQKQEIAAITKEIRQRDQNVSISDAKARAERVVENAYGTLAKNIEVRKTTGQKLQQAGKDMLKATKDRITSLKNSAKSLIKEKGVFGAAKAGAGAIGQSVNKGVQATAQGLAGAQNLAFAGAAIGGVVTSLGLFEEATNKAASQAIAFGTTSLGLVATLAQTVAGFTASAAASNAQALASGKATVADLAESSASFGAAGVIGVFVIAVTAAISVLYFWSAQAKATAEKASKDFDTALKDLSSGSEGVASRLKAAAEVEVNSRAESAKLFNSSTVSIVAGSAAAGAALGSIVPVLGTAVGAAVGAVAGAVAGLVIAVTGAQAALEEEKRAAQQETIARNEAIDGLVKLAKAVNDSEKEFKRIDSVIGLADQRNDEGFKQTTLLKQQQTIKDIQATGGSDVATKADKTLQEIANRTGQTISELKGLKVDELAKAIRAGDKRNVAAAGKAVLQGSTSGPNAKALDDNLRLALKRRDAGDVEIFSAAKAFQIAALTVENRAKLLEKNLAESGSQLQDLFSDAPVDAAFEDLIKEGTAIGTALQIRAKALRASAAEEDRIAREQIANLEKRARAEGLSAADSDALAGLKKGIEDRKRATDDQIAQEKALLKEGQDARNANAIAIREEAARRAAIVQALKLQEIALRDANLALKEAKNINSNIEFGSSVDSNDLIPDVALELDLESPIPQDVINNVEKFRVSIGNLTTAQQKQANAAIDQVIASQKTAQLLQSGLAGQETVDIQGGKADQILAALFPDGSGGSKITDEILLKAFANVPGAVEQFKEDLEKASQSGGVLTVQEVEQLIAPIKEAGGKAGDTLSVFNDVINAQIQRTNLLLQKENEARNRNLEAVATYNDQILKGAQVIASAEAELSGRNANAGRSAAILAASQRTLNAGRAGRGGRDLDAQDSAALAQEKRGAIIRKKFIDAEIKSLKLKQQEGKLSQEQVDKLGELQRARNVEINTIKDVTKAQQEQISALDSQIALVAENLKKASEKIKKSREQAFATVSEFVLGGEETRKSLNAGAAGIVKALRTGTLQNQSEERRSQTVSLLDKLKDVQIGNTGLTGSEVKQRLIFQDAIRLGFPPEVAQELSTSTTVEENMLQQLKELVRIQNGIARNAGVASADTQLPAFATGGVVYRADGGTIFKPKGTDTVPAMLTPGEFVIRKSAVDKVGVGALSAINQGQPIYRANGSNKPEEPLDLDKLLAETPNSSVNEQQKLAKKRKLEKAKKDAGFSDLKQENSQISDLKKLDPFFDVEGFQASRAAGKKFKAEQDAKVARDTAAYNDAVASGKRKPLYDFPETQLEKGESVEDVLKRGRARDEKIKAEAARPFQKNFGDLDGARRKVFDDEFKAEQAAAREAAKPEKVRNIAAKAYEDAIAQGFSKDYATNAGFRAVDAARIVKTPAKGDKPATYYGRQDVIGAVEANTAVNNANKPDGSKREISKSDELQAFANAQDAKREKQEDLVANRTPSSGPKDFSAKALNSLGQRRISPQAQRRLQRKGGGAAAIQQTANAAREKFIIQAYQDGWDKKSADDRKSYLFAGDSGYRSALKGTSRYSGPEYYEYANFAINKYIQQQKAADSSPEADKQVPASTAAEANEAASRKAEEQRANDAEAGRLGYDRGVGSWKGRNDGLTENEYQLGKTDASIRARNNLIKQGFSKGRKERPSVLQQKRSERAEAQKTREAFDPLDPANNNRPSLTDEQREKATSLSGPTFTRNANGQPEIDKKKRTGLGSNRVTKPRKFAQGGGVAGSDTIPAMLTPGEFVMSREAVQRNGVGYMRNLNKGVVKGFRRGGLVGTGNVRYRATGSNDAEGAGGGLAIDASGLQQVLTDFSAGFKEAIDNVTATFSSISGSLDGLANAINQGMTVTHQFSGDMKMAFKIENGDQLKNSIAEALTPKISQIIVEEVDKRLNQDGFKAGG